MDSDRTGWRSDLFSLPSPVDFTEIGQLCAIGELSLRLQKQKFILYRYIYAYISIYYRLYLGCLVYRMILFEYTQSRVYIHKIQVY